jgi:hypothetical protein
VVPFFALLGLNVRFGRIYRQSAMIRCKYLSFENFNIPRLLRWMRFSR